MEQLYKSLSPERKFVLTQEALTYKSDEEKYFESWFSATAIEADGNFYRTLAAELLGLTNAPAKPKIDELYNHVLNKNAVLVYKDDLANIGFLLRDLAIVDKEYQKPASEIFKKIEEYSGSLDPLKNDIKKFNKLFGSIQITTTGTPVVSSPDIEKLEEIIENLTFTIKLNAEATTSLEERVINLTKEKEQLLIDYGELNDKIGEELSNLETFLRVPHTLDEIKTYVANLQKEFKE